MNSKAQFDLATKEVIAFFRTLAYNDVMLRCDNEPSVLQLQRLVVQARQQMWLWTQACTPSAYEYGNALAENAIQRIRVLAGSLHAWFTDEAGSHREFQSCVVVMVHEACCMDFSIDTIFIKGSQHMKWSTVDLRQSLCHFEKFARATPRVKSMVLAFQNVSQWADGFQLLSWTTVPS